MTNSSPWNITMLLIGKPSINEFGHIKQQMIGAINKQIIRTFTLT